MWSKNYRLQNIQLSKIVERHVSRYRALRRLEHSCSRFKLRSSQNLNLKQTSLSLFEKLMVELNGIEPLTPCLQSRCSPN